LIYDIRSFPSSLDPKPDRHYRRKLAGSEHGQVRLPLFRFYRDAEVIERVPPAGSSSDPYSSMNSSGLLDTCRY
ncbi:MAG TPA: hypothetical protein VJ124_05810, partial [Pyrinomonadaceae bacterium]|nr:hypothetical protein [Pyrinomonadaceae bacterium]